MAQLSPPPTFVDAVDSSDDDLVSFASLRITGDTSPTARVLQPSPDITSQIRPELMQRNTDPAPSSTLQLPRLQPKPRPRSPYSRGHLRSHSASATIAPPMARTRSLPTVSTSNPVSTPPSLSPARPSSPLRPPPSIRSSPRRSFEETRPILSGAAFTEIESIAEDRELDLTQSSREAQSSPLPSFSAAFSRSNSGRGRRRPTSPLYQQQVQPPEQVVRMGSPSLSTARFNEPHPYSAGSSIPSTPTSIRSRSPSISSLETIPDSPDAEDEATESYHVAQLKLAADAADAAEADAETTRKLRDIGLVVPTDGSSSTSMWSPQRLKEKRKRWSVCGAERRGDFEMETIWED